MRQEQGWSYEVHELSEGYSAIVYDEHGTMIADHLTEEVARKIAAAPDLLEALTDAETLFDHTFAMNGSIHKKMRAAIARARGNP